MSWLRTVPHAGRRLTRVLRRGPSCRGEPAPQRSGSRALTP